MICAKEALVELHSNSGRLRGEELQKSVKNENQRESTAPPLRADKIEESALNNR
jgi:hypothetical protein